MKKETHNKSNKIYTSILIISILLIATFFIMVISFKNYFEPNMLIPVIVLILGLIGLVFSTILLIINGLKSINTKKFQNRNIIIFGTIAFTIIFTAIFNFSLYVLISLLIIDVSLLILSFGYYKKRADSLKFKQEKYEIKIKNIFFVLILIIMLLYFAKISPFKYYTMLGVYTFSLISGLFFRKNVENFYKKLEKLPKKKYLEIKENIEFRRLIFLFSIPVIIDINFSVLYVPTAIHLIVVGLYLLLFFVFVSSNEDK